MAHPQIAPCVNINDEFVQVVSIDVTPSGFVKQGDVIGSVETDKALVDVVAEQDGYVLRIDCQPQQKVRVGSTILWLGATADEPIPEAAAASAHGPGTSVTPTAKARVMLKELGLDPSLIPAQGTRLTVADIQAWVERSGRRDLQPGSISKAIQPAEPRPLAPGTLEQLSADATGMLHTVLWHRDHAVPGYLEVEYDPAPWEAHAAQYATQHKLLLSPLLPLLAFRLALIARARPEINATLLEGQRYRYEAVNMGFTVQAGSTLYLGVVRDTQQMDAPRFIAALGEVQRHAMAHKLRPEESSGATLSFTSMARWNVSRHVPILPPLTSLIVAHTKARSAGVAVLGASYDHRLLSGFDVVQVLQELSRPPAESPTARTSEP